MATRTNTRRAEAPESDWPTGPKEWPWCCATATGVDDDEHGRAYHERLIQLLSHVNGIAELDELLWHITQTSGEGHELTELLIRHWDQFTDPHTTFSVIRTFERWQIDFEERQEMLNGTLTRSRAAKR